MQNHPRQRVKRGHDVDWGATVTGAPASGSACSTKSEPRANSKIGVPSMAVGVGGSAKVPFSAQKSFDSQCAAGLFCNEAR